MRTVRRCLGLGLAAATLSCLGCFSNGDFERGAALGSACSLNAECDSGVCVAGVCTRLCPDGACPSFPTWVCKSGVDTESKALRVCLPR